MLVRSPKQSLQFFIEQDSKVRERVASNDKASRDSEFDDFIGKSSLVFSSDDQAGQTAHEPAFGLRNSLSAVQIWEQVYNKDSDNMARSACLAFKNGRITREEAANFLALRQVNEIADHWQYGNLENNPQGVEIATFFSPQDPSQVVRNNYFQITIDLRKLEDTRILGLLFLAYNLKTIHFDNSELTKLQSWINPPYSSSSPFISFTIPDLSTMNHITKLRYGDHAKKLLPRLGNFSINDIEASVQMKARYAVFSHPAVPSPKEFHDVKAPAFYMSLHDELHRQLISSIPNQTYEAYLHAIKIVRTKTGIHWSKEIWNGIDMEIGDFLTLSQAERDDKTCEKNSSNFCKLLSARIFSTQDPQMLFDFKGPGLDTTLILLIDIYKNRSDWEDRYAICPIYFTGQYLALYNHVSERIDDLEEQQLSETILIATLKAKLLNIKLPQGSATFEKQDKYLQIQIDNKTWGPSKARQVALKQYEIAHANLGGQLAALNQHQGFSNLHQKGRAVVQAIKSEMNPEKSSLAEIHFYTESLKMTDLLLNPINRKNKVFHEQYNALIEKGKPSMPKLVLGVMLAFLGAATIALSLFLTAASFGIASPLTIGGLALGGSAFLGGLGLFKNGLRESSSQAMVDFRKSISTP